MSKFATFVLVNAGFKKAQQGLVAVLLLTLKCSAPCLRAANINCHLTRRIYGQPAEYFYP